MKEMIRLGLLLDAEARGFIFSLKMGDEMKVVFTTNADVFKYKVIINGNIKSEIDGKLGTYYKRRNHLIVIK